MINLNRQRILENTLALFFSFLPFAITALIIVFICSSNNLAVDNKNAQAETIAQIEILRTQVKQLGYLLDGKRHNHYSSK